jgi:hypothetical protein
MAKYAVCYFCVGLILGMTEYLRAQDAAHFWLSVDDDQSAGPETPSPIQLDLGESAEIQIWGRPMPGRKLRGFSLNLVASAPGVDFIDGTFVVHNVSIGRSSRRFQYVHDSFAEDPGGIVGDAELISESDGIEQADAVNGLLGFGLLGFLPEPPLVIQGIGGLCSPLDANCVIASDGNPAWLIATVELQGVGMGEIELHLQIGDSGMRHEFLPGDYNFDSVVDVGDYNLWRSTFGSTDGDNGGLLADGNRNGTIDAADYVFWKDNVGAAPVLESSAETSVRFGTDSLGGQEPLYNAGFLGDREITLPMDDSDAVINVNAPSAASLSELTQHETAAIVIPEPSSLALLLVGVVGLLQRTRYCCSDHSRSRRCSLR